MMNILDKWKTLEEFNKKDITMKKFQHKPGSGSLFPTQNKIKDTYPDFTGKIVVAKNYKVGDEIRIAGWKKESTLGTFLSLSESTYETKVFEGSNRDIGQSHE
jgi:hypothetical protein